MAKRYGTTTGTGVVRLEVSPFPSCPFDPVTQQWVTLPLVKPQVCAYPALKWDHECPPVIIAGVVEGVVVSFPINTVL